MQDLVFYGAALAVSAYIFRVWLADLTAYRRRQAKGSAAASDDRPVFPGAVPVRFLSVVVAVSGAVLLLAAETAGEHKLGIDQQQTEMTWLFALYTLAAAFVEELIFRGYLVYERGSRAGLLASIIGVSLVFAVLHPYLWKWQKPPDAAFWQASAGWLSLDLGNKALFSTGFVFARSLWFYCVRFWPANPLRSLISCIAAHAAINLGVIAVKLAEGKLVGWY